MLALDNVGDHRAPAVRARWAAPGGRVVPLWLPADTPTLNPIERVRRFLEQTLACHRSWAAADGLASAAATRLARLAARCHADHRPAIRPAQDFCQSA